LSEELLVCPDCARTHPSSERFCEACGMLLVHREIAPGQTTERRRQARKIKPEYADGPLVKVAQVGSQPEAEFIAALLLEEGIPSLLSGQIAGYAPVVGARAVLVPESGAQAAREALAWQRPAQA
jgi:Putative prokaryotic signal transducing protein